MCIGVRDVSGLVMFRVYRISSLGFRVRGYGLGGKG